MSQKITYGIISFLILASIAYIFLTNCSVSLRCGEGFELGALTGSDGMSMPEQEKRLEYQQALMRAKGNYTRMKQEAQSVAKMEAEGDAVRLENYVDNHQAPVNMMQERHNEDPVGFSSFQAEYASL